MYCDIIVILGHVSYRIMSYPTILTTNSDQTSQTHSF